MTIEQALNVARGLMENGEAVALERPSDNNEWVVINTSTCETFTEYHGD